jgi:hypothetical protein
MKTALIAVAVLVAALVVFPKITGHDLNEPDPGHSFVQEWPWDNLNQTNQTKK